MGSRCGWMDCDQMCILTRAAVAVKRTVWKHPHQKPKTYNQVTVVAHRGERSTDQGGNRFQELMRGRLNSTTEGMWRVREGS